MPINRNVSVPPPPPPAPSAEVLALRSNWKWAYLSHFLFTFNPLLHLEDIALSELEDDLAHGTYNVLPTVMQRLLMMLVPHDKRVILEDWQHQLRRQSLKRDPDHNVLGTDDEPIEFESLIMTDKLNLFHSLCEWQFHNTTNLRLRMKDDDEFANWRIEPIARDSKGNNYWLMGGNRLWRQYAPTRKRPPPPKKRKRPATAASNGRKSAKRNQPSRAVSKASTPATRSHKATPVPQPTTTRGGRRPVRETRSHAAGLQQRSKAIGTRVSSRLRGRGEEEELWQEIPEEWLKEGAEDEKSSKTKSDHEEEDEDEGPRRSKRKGKSKEMNKKERAKEKAKELLDDVSDLTSLSELSDVPDPDKSSDENYGEGGDGRRLRKRVKREETDDEDEDVEDDEEHDEEDGEEEPERSPSPIPDYSTPDKEVWQTVCVTIEEWEEFPKQFENSTHKGEKAFYKLLTTHLVPGVIEVLREEARKKIVVEEPVAHERKRSSRLAVKESIKQAELDAARKKAEEEKEHDRHRRWEARARKEEEERLKRENMRSTRLRERTRKELGLEDLDGDGDIDILGDDSESKPGVNGTKTENGTEPPSKSGTQTPKEDETWILDCEICHRKGQNLDGDQGLLCCEKCNRWHHIRCHDEADLIAGRPKRNWDKEEFVCSACRGVPPPVVKVHAKGRSKGSKGRQQAQPRQQTNQYATLASHPSNWPVNGYVNGAGAAAKQGQVQTHPPLPSQHPSIAATYPNGRPIYPMPAPGAPGTAYYPYYNAYAPAPVATGAASTSQARTTLPYSTSPNKYMSDYGQPGYRAVQQAQGSPTQAPAQVPQQSHPSASSHPAAAPLQISHYRPPTATSSGSASPPAAATGSWSPQQISYQAQAWVGTSGTQPYGANLGATTNGYKAYVPQTATAAYTGRPLAPAPQAASVSPRPQATVPQATVPQQVLAPQQQPQQTYHRS